MRQPPLEKHLSSCAPLSDPPLTMLRKYLPLSKGTSNTSKTTETSRIQKCSPLSKGTLKTIKTPETSPL